MSRSERLLALLQLLRGHRYAITGSELASQLGISLRTLYRDIATLQAQGAHIEGEAGIGYVLRPGFMLPPLMFSEEELDALVLGSRWVAAHADHALSTAASSALAKIEAVLPADYRQQLHANALLIGTARGDSPVDEAPLRSAIRQQRHPPAAQGDPELSGSQGSEFAAHRLALRPRLLRPGAGTGGLVRAAPGLSPLSGGQDQRDAAGGGALSWQSGTVAQGVARQPADPAAQIHC